MPSRNNHQQNKQINTKQKTAQGRKRHNLKIAFQLLLLTFLLIIAGTMLYFYLAYGKTILLLQSEAKNMVSTSTEDTFRASQTSLVYDSQGNLISTLKAEKDVYYLKFEEIPTAVVDAMVVSEDRKFFEHGGVDYLANIRAAIALIEHKGEITQGASTITQQLARNVFLSNEVTYKRKIAEIFIAQELEKKYNKYDIMEFYLNGIYFANGHYGIQAASQAYFGEGISSLSLSQIAFLCAIPNNPNLYNPLTHMENTLKRRDRILRQMQESGKISEAKYRTALAETITLKQDKKDKKNYVETYVYYKAVRALMQQQGFEFRYQFGSEEDEAAYDKEYDDLYYSLQKELYVKGYRIYTSIDMGKQELLQNSVDDALKSFTSVNEEGVYQMQGAAVCIDNETGKVVAIVGGRDQELAGYTLNRAYQSYRQPGSSIKPLIVYTPAFERGYTPYSMVSDKYTKDGPRNSDGGYLGKIKLQKAIELSKNTVAWKLFKKLTPQVGLSYLRSMNFAKIKDTDYVPAAALGGLTVGVSPVEMAAAYSALENDGYYREPTCIIRITDAEGKDIIGDNSKEKQVYQTNAARIMTEALTGVIKRGTARGLGLSNTVSAGKTGTTNDKKDGWFVGYTPYYTTSVWVGYDLPKTVDNLKGATYPGTIWHNFMEKIHTPSMTKEFEKYDWRAVLKAKRKEEELKRKEQEALQNQEAQEVPVGQDILSQEDIEGQDQQAGGNPEDQAGQAGQNGQALPSNPKEQDNQAADGNIQQDGNEDTDTKEDGEDPDALPTEEAGTDSNDNNSEDTGGDFGEGSLEEGQTEDGDTAGVETIDPASQEDNADNNLE